MSLQENVLRSPKGVASYSIHSPSEEVEEAPHGDLECDLQFPHNAPPFHSLTRNWDFKKRKGSHSGSPSGAMEVL